MRLASRGWPGPGLQYSMVQRFAAISKHFCYSIWWYHFASYQNNAWIVFYLTFAIKSMLGLCPKLIGHNSRQTISKSRKTFLRKELVRCFLSNATGFCSLITSNNYCGAMFETNCFYSFVQEFYHATEIGNVANVVRTCAGQPSRQNKDNCFG